jgi:uncharacterized metal-binding protein
MQPFHSYISLIFGEFRAYKMEKTQRMKIVSCSGASNTGEFSDLYARKPDAAGGADCIVWQLT